MNKLVLLKFVGRSIEAGFQVTLQIGEPQARPTIEHTASLPACPDLVIALHNWRQAYQAVHSASRRKSAITISPSETGETQVAPSPTRIKGRPGEVPGMPHPDANSPINLSDAASNPDRKSNCQLAAQTLEQQFNQWLRSPEFRPLREVWLEHLRSDDEIQICLQTDCRGLQQLPWHLWDLIDRDSQLEVAIAALNYQWHQTPEAQSIQPRQIIKILAILGDAGGIDIQTDRQILESLPETQIQFLVAPQRSTLSEQLWNHPVDILFFAGHSLTQGESGRIFINEMESLTLEELRYALKKAIAQGLQLAIFNSCEGLGLANVLADLNIPQIIVMREPVPDEVAQTFLKFFLAHFSQNAPLPTAVRQARERLQSLEGNYPNASWLPVLVQHPIAVPAQWNRWLGRTSDRIIQPRWHFPKKQWKWLPIAAVASSAIVLGLRHWGLLQSLELAAYDRLVQMRPAEPQDDRILIIEVTEADVKAQSNESRRGSLSDQRLLKLLDILKPLKPAAIGLDIYRDYPINPKLPKLIQHFTASPPSNAPSNSSILNSSILNSQFSIPFISICRSQDAVSKLPAIDPPPELDPANLGFSNLVLDSDRILRRHLLSLSPAPDSSCTADYALSTQLALQYLFQREYELNFQDKDWVFQSSNHQLQFKILAAHGSGYQGVDAWGHQILVNYRHYRSVEDAFPRITLNQALNRQFNPEAVTGKIILIGTTAESFKDVIMTPFRQNGQSVTIPGVILQAQLTSQLISAVLDRRPLFKTVPMWVDGLWILSWAIAGVLIVGCRQWVWVGTGLVGAGSLVTIGAGAGLLVYGVWIAWVPAMLSLSLGFGLVRSIEQLNSNRIQRSSKSAQISLNQ